MADLGIIFLKRRYPIHWYQSFYIFITGSMPFRYFWATLYSYFIKFSTVVSQGSKIKLVNHHLFHVEHILLPWGFKTISNSELLLNYPFNF